MRPEQASSDVSEMMMTEIMAVCSENHAKPLSSRFSLWAHAGVSGGRTASVVRGAWGSYVSSETLVSTWAVR
jgi:hypothetical protein